MSAHQPIDLPPSRPNPGGPRHPDPADLALYAMQLLSGDEAATIAHHVETCTPCHEELGRILSDVAACAHSRPRVSLGGFS